MKSQPKPLHPRTVHIPVFQLLKSKRIEYRIYFNLIQDTLCRYNELLLLRLLPL